MCTPMSNTGSAPASMLEELAREATIDDVAVLVEGNGAEQHGNGEVLKSAEVLQVGNVELISNV